MLVTDYMFNIFYRTTWDLHPWRSVVPVKQTVHYTYTLLSSYICIYLSVYSWSPMFLFVAWLEPLRQTPEIFTSHLKPITQHARCASRLRTSQRHYLREYCGTVYRRLFLCLATGNMVLVVAERSCREFVWASVAVHIDGFGGPWPITWRVPTIVELESANLAEGQGQFLGITPLQGPAPPLLLVGRLDAAGAWLVYCTLGRRYGSLTISGGTCRRRNTRDFMIFTVVRLEKGWYRITLWSQGVSEVPWYNQGNLTNLSSKHW